MLNMTKKGLDLPNMTYRENTTIIHIISNKETFRQAASKHDNTHIMNVIIKDDEKLCPLVPGTSAVLCMTDQLGAFDSRNLIVPIRMV